ncbi:unnamed protein product [Phytophthora fragariaefolia]|uniref:Unnamed protein product n=1 Tax=Phytophthora fragariaefolia TaxID=1490495 RepID=A0A9W7CJG7_9STRA|nr:unnamed protein product [Phytophthora fragariaefolia]
MPATRRSLRKSDEILNGEIMNCLKGLRVRDPMDIDEFVCNPAEDRTEMQTLSTEELLCDASDVAFLDTVGDELDDNSSDGDDVESAEDARPEPTTKEKADFVRGVIFMLYEHPDLDDKLMQGHRKLQTLYCTVHSLTASLQSILLPEIRHRVQDVAKKFKPTQAFEKTDETFYMNLPLRAMCCDLDESKVARIYGPILALKLSFDAYIAIQPLRSHDDSGDVSYKPLFYDGRRPAKYSLRDFACDQELKDAKTAHSIRKALAFFTTPEWPKARS